MSARRRLLPRGERGELDAERPGGLLDSRSRESRALANDRSVDRLDVAQRLGREAEDVSPADRVPRLRTQTATCCHAPAFYSSSARSAHAPKTFCSCRRTSTPSLLGWRCARRPDVRGHGRERDAEGRRGLFDGSPALRRASASDHALDGLWVAAALSGETVKVGARDAGALGHGDQVTSGARADWAAEARLLGGEARTRRR
jgi:hypothetical protein